MPLREIGHLWVTSVAWAVTAEEVKHHLALLRALVDGLNVLKREGEAACAHFLPSGV
ncbi:MAG: hypothetical protein M3014_01510 [Chloroflexota bacterium]|nr:hypothetical protein [Chloroflexota bacterium]